VRKKTTKPAVPWKTGTEQEKENMKPKVELTKVSQFCLEADPLLNFIKKLPRNVKVGDIRFRGNSNSGRKSQVIPEDLKRAGLQSVVHLGNPVEIRGLMKGVTPREHILKTVQKISKLHKVSPEKFYICDITLTDSEGASSLSFHRMYKSIKLPNDKRRKKLVLGMRSGAGLDYHSFLADLSAKKISCTFGKVEKTIVMCSEEVVVRK
jgi:hypothetical protein